MNKILDDSYEYEDEYLKENLLMIEKKKIVIII
jgi:hypothetical protein